MTQWLPHASLSPQALLCGVWTESPEDSVTGAHTRVRIHREELLMLQMTEGKGQASSLGPSRPGFHPWLQHRQGLHKCKVGAKGLPRPVLWPAQGWGAARVPSTVNVHRGDERTSAAELQQSHQVSSSFIHGEQTYSIHTHGSRCKTPRRCHFQGNPKEAFF